MMVAFAVASSTNKGTIPGEKLLRVGRCPHCSVASPNLNLLWHDTWQRVNESRWASFRCATCGGVVTTLMRYNGSTLELHKLWPDTKSAHEDIPDPARTFLQQAYETLHAPDAAAVMAGSAVDAMLKVHGYVEGSLYKRIDEALKDNVLTSGMAQWAHTVRLGSNRPRHADEKKPHVSPDEAKHSVDFAEALGNFLFVLTARIDRGIKAAEEAEGTD
ncbi:hypothetical protein EL18_01539 [Nitratireductor basaltis]|uniref:DUF4145 domain-containing protein n=2 Tax=Nitratireductor basaltis TaxID=472175 RepID=A0A084UC18_9HYPH|nr:hypothetical protein EL18_01539 [Nitratireductor basaltis]